MQIKINTRLIERNLDSSDAGYTSADIDYLYRSTETPVDSWLVVIEVQHLMQLHIPSQLKTAIVENALQEK